MARFYGEIKGRSQEISRVGDKSSGMTAHIRGWDIGVKIELRTDGDADELTVYVTGGSNNENDQRLVYYDEYGKKHLITQEKEFRLVIRPDKPISLSTDS